MFQQGTPEIDVGIIWKKVTPKNRNLLRERENRDKKLVERKKIGTWLDWQFVLLDTGTYVDCPGRLSHRSNIPIRLTQQTTTSYRYIPTIIDLKPSRNPTPLRYRNRVTDRGNRQIQWLYSNSFLEEELNGGSKGLKFVRDAYRCFIAELVKNRTEKVET